MRTEILRGLAVAILATLVVGGCTRQSEVFSSKTPEQLEQLIEVTDGVVLLARSVSGGEGSSSERDAARRQAIAALGAAHQQFRQHSHAIVNRENADALACVGAQAIDIMDLEIVLGRLAEAEQRGDAVTVQHRKNMLVKRAMDASQCALMSELLLIRRENRREALEHGAVLISEMYAIALINRVVADLPLAMLMKEQIEAYEAIAAKLGPNREVQVVTDALPKLRATLQVLQRENA